MGKFLELVVENDWEYAIRKNSKGIVIICVYNKDNHKYLVVEQYRIPVKKRLIEFPAGLIELNESIKGAAIRELKEELGLVYASENLINLGSVYSSAGLTNEKAHLFAAIIDNSTAFMQPQLDLKESENGLRQLWVSEDTLINAEAAKVLSTLLRFKEKYLQYI
jgi:8-oxo-dGTP pyrophosphatase MutT (NUDIX family)